MIPQATIQSQSSSNHLELLSSAPETREYDSHVTQNPPAAFRDSESGKFQSLLPLSPGSFSYYRPVADDGYQEPLQSEMLRPPRALKKSDSLSDSIPGSPEFDKRSDIDATDSKRDGVSSTDTSQPPRPLSGFRKLVGIFSKKPALIVETGDPDFAGGGIPITPAIIKNLRGLNERHVHILELSKALLYFGAPTHRIEHELSEVAKALGAHVSFVHIPTILLVTLGDGATKVKQTHIVRSNGRIALSCLAEIHDITLKVCNDNIACDEGTRQLKNLLAASPLYPWYLRCALTFVSSSIICTTAFGGSIIDMGISGVCSAFLQYLNLNSAMKGCAMLDNVFEISVSIVVSFFARGLSTIPDDLFCYSAISSAGVVTILPGFTILLSALELTSRNILCGSIRMVYAVIYTLFLGFSLTLGSDLFLTLDKQARQEYLHPTPPVLSYFHGVFVPMNGTDLQNVTGTLGFANLTTEAMHHIYKGCYRNADWPWWREPLPSWTLLFLVPIYSACSSLSNLQDWRRRDFYIMVLISCTAYAANKRSNVYFIDRSDIVSAIGAVVVGALGNAYSRLTGGNAFICMVTGILFLVPSSIAQAGGLSQNYQSSAQQYSAGFGLAVRMVTVAVGVTIGLFVSQVVLFRRENETEGEDDPAY